VATLIAAGCSNAEVATRLGISAATAKKHADALRYKLGVARRRQIPRAYLERTGVDLLRAGTP
jgi:ATP/maltotriose-dependent transcriptional regulator MalT